MDILPRKQERRSLRDCIAETCYLHLGDLDQWVMIRGESISNPVLILLHGGPGFPEVRFFRTFNATLESSFTVVYWEQRGTHKSFHHGISASTMTIEQFISDLDELVEIVCKRLKKSKVVIYGHSWGSALGVLYAARFPEKVLTYVGSGQVADIPTSELSSYLFVLAEARRRNKPKALRELRGIGAPPHTAKKMMVQRKWLIRFLGVARGMSLWEFVRIALGRPESSPFDLWRILQGMSFSVNSMWDEITNLNLIEQVPELKMPVFFFLGRHDRVVDAKTSSFYFETLIAPSKKLVWFENTTHDPASEEAEKFNAMMAEFVRPIATL
jgi:pimeloyl-ACP methyl ester carboxylesterase